MKNDNKIDVTGLDARTLFFFLFADKFNLYGLRAVIPNYLECLSLILDKTGRSILCARNLMCFVCRFSMCTDDDAEPETLQNAIDLYGLIHARYVITTRGLDAMVSSHTQHTRHQNEYYLFCSCASIRLRPLEPVRMSNATIVLLCRWVWLYHHYQWCFYSCLTFTVCCEQVGTHDDLCFDKVKVYCPKCQNIYQVQPQDGVEGASPQVFCWEFACVIWINLQSWMGPISAPLSHTSFSWLIHTSHPLRARSNTSLVCLDTAFTMSGHQGRWLRTIVIRKRR